MTAAPTFDLTGPLPSGRIAIEASAGTGKTYTLAALACRLVIEHDIPINEFLVVTFTRAAAAELRDRVRQRLVQALAALEGDAGDDPLLRALTAVDPDELDRRRHRARSAVTDFDSATITTIHGFATQVLATLGSAAPGDPDATLVDDSRELIDRCTADALAAAALALAGEPLPLDQLDGAARADLHRLAEVLDEAALADTGESVAALLPKPTTLRALASKILGNPGITVEPSAEIAHQWPATAVLCALVDVVVGAVSRHRRARGTLSYDDVLTQVRDALRSPTSGERARLALQRRFRVALIDEFQDTDPVQSQIFEALFPPEGPGALVLVGDPKQAIYAFRGADVHTYLDAAHGPGVERFSLGTNYRSDGAVIEALDGLLSGLAFGDEQIQFRSVSAAPELAEQRLTDRAGAPRPALQVRLVTGPWAAERPIPKKADQLGVIGVANLRDAVAADLAANVRDLLEHGVLPVPDGTGGTTRPVRPDDIAMLIRNGSHATPIRRALEAHRIPVVIARPGSVTDSPAAEQLRVLLHALARPSDTTRARAFALTWFGGWDAATLDRADDAQLGELHARLGAWAERLGTSSVAGALALVRADTEVIARRLETPDGDRDVTDLDHLGELLHGATGGRPCAPVQVLDALDELQRRTDETERELVDRRTESDAPAVHIITMHSAKGLEFPIVYCPSLLEGSGTIDETSCIYRDPDTGARTIDIANKVDWPGRLTGAERKTLAQAELSGESLRLAYVALTRAQHQVTFWWAKHRDAARSPLAAILFARDEDGQIDPVALAKPTMKIPGDEGALDALGWLEGAAEPGLIAVTELTAPTPRPDAPWVPADAAPAPDLPAEPARLGRHLERLGSRWSFTSITRHDADAPFDPYDTADGDAGAADEGPDQVHDVDDTTPPPTPAVDAAPADGPALPLADVPGSAEFGTLVHAVLEVVDFTTPDLDAELDAAIADLGRWNDWPVEPSVVRQGLRAAIDTPLGPAFDGRRLRDIPRTDRLDELSFELRLAATGHASALADLGAAVVRHLPADDPLRPWAEGLAAGQFPVRLAGHLTGSIDAVIRVPGADAATPDRYVVVDYKTNTLGPRGVPLTGAAYHPAELPHEMAHHHYPLQALLYSVALHRYLRWRLPHYDPATHLGGAGYLFLRGMVGADTPAPDGAPHGVFTWRPPAALIVELSDLLHGLESAA